MTDEQRERLHAALIEFGRAAQAALEAMRPLIDVIERAFAQLRRFVVLALRQLELLPTPRHLMTRKKIRRMLLLQAQVGSYGTIRMRGSNPPYLFDPLLN